MRPSEKRRHARADSATPQGEAGDSSTLNESPDESDKPLPLRSVLTRPVVVTVANYAILALLNAVTSTYIPLVWSTPVEFGGLNMSPASIGLGLSVYGTVEGILQFVFFPYLVGRFGLRRLFTTSIGSCALVYTFFPFENLVLRLTASDGANTLVWLLIILQLSSFAVFDMGYSTAFKFQSSPPLMLMPITHVGSLRCDVHVHHIYCSEQTVSRHGLWSVAGGVLNPERRLAGNCRLAICVLPDS